MKKVEALFAGEAKQELNIVDGLFIVWRSETPQETGFFQDFPYTNPKVMFDKIRGDLSKAIEQINQYIFGRQIEKTPDRAIIFLSGTDPWSIEWNTMWESLSTGSDPELIGIVKKTREEAQKLIGIPFELIVGKDNPLRYVPFPWPH